jgi:ribosomal protein L44E
MDNNQNNTQAPGNQESAKPKKTITTEVKCSKCGNVETVTIEVPEEGETPKMAWTS